MEYSDTNNQLWLVSLKHAKTNEVIIKANSDVFSYFLMSFTVNNFILRLSAHIIQTRRMFTRLN